MESKNDQSKALAWSCESVGMKNLSDRVRKTNEERFKGLAAYLDKLVNEDFERLIALLYRIDVSQEKATAALAQNNGKESPGETLAHLIIARQAEKIKWRKRYQNP